MNRLLTFGIAAILGALFIPVGTFADNPTSAAADTSVYRLGPSDAIAITVVNFPELTTSAVVGPDGRITVPLLPSIEVTGKTTAELTRILTEQWNRYVVNPAVTISLTAKRHQTVMFYGSVGKIGPVDYHPGMRILEALADAGGAGNVGELGQVTITHPDGRRETLDLSHPQTKGGTDLDVVLQEGDMVYVPERRSQFSVLGQVGTPGSYNYRDDMTVLDALTAVGGVKETANLESATIIHDGRQSALDLVALLRKGDLTGNIKLSPGDVISVPERPIQVGLLGEGRTTGNFPYRDGMTLIDLLTAAGGVTDNADLDNAVLIRNGQETKLNLRALLKQGDLSLNMKLTPGDVVKIPQSRAEITVLGEVGHPGNLVYKDDTTALDVLTAAGGVTADADLNAATIVHEGKETKLDLDALLRRGDTSANVKLAAGDRILVPEIVNKTYIFGAVARPGYYPIRPGDRVMDAINGSGGPLHEADLKHARVIHIDKAKNTATVTRIDVATFLTKGDTTGNVVLKPGDVVYVPDKKKGFSFGDVFSALSGLNLLTSAVRIIGL